MRVSRMAACCLLGMGSLVATAQMKNPLPAGPPVGTAATPSAALDSQLSLIELEMMGAVKAMPADKFAFAPSAAIFVPGQKTEFPKVRTFAEQVTHVAEANYFFASLVSGVKPDVDTKGLEKLTGKDEVVAALAASFVFSHKAVATLTPENAFVVVKSPEPGFATHATMASFLVEHAYDHYGQMVEYLRMNAIVPPASQ
jgi:DinB superfamily